MTEKLIEKFLDIFIKEILPLTEKGVRKGNKIFGAAILKKNDLSLVATPVLFFERIELFRIKKEPPMTRFLASQLATSHYYNISRAKNDFGYMPLVSHDEGMKRLIQSLSHPTD